MTTLRAADWNTGPAPRRQCRCRRERRLDGLTGDAAEEAAETAVNAARSDCPPPPASDDLHTLDIRVASERLRRGRLTSLALTESCLQRIDTLNPELNAFITITREEALAAARDSRRGDRARRVARPAARYPDLAERPHRSAGDRHDRRVASCLIGQRLRRMHRSRPPCGEPARCSSARRIFTSSRSARPATSPHSARSAILWIASGQPAGRAEVRRLRWRPACRSRPSARTPADRSGFPRLRAASWG